MFKKIALVAFLASTVLSQDTMAGGYKPVSSKDLLNLQNDEMFAHAYLLARKDYEEKTNGKIGKLIAVSTQVVAGVNYKMIFETSSGQYEIVVFCQPWTNTYEVTSMKPMSNVE